MEKQMHEMYQDSLSRLMGTYRLLGPSFLFGVRQIISKTDWPLPMKVQCLQSTCDKSQMSGKPDCTNASIMSTPYAILENKLVTEMLPTYRYKLSRS